MMVTNTEREALLTWEESSQYWKKHHGLIEEMFAPLTTALIEAAEIRAGQSVLDVGGGSGQPSLAIAPLVGTRGLVTYTDPASGMVTTAREEAQRRSLTNIEFYQAPAEQLPFPADRFDVAVSRLAAMFFPNVPAGLREILRVVKPGSAVSFLMWRGPEVNPFFRNVTEVLDQYVPPELEDEDAPGAFRFARSGKFAKLLSEAGATSVDEQPVPFRIEAPVTLEQFWTLRSEMSDTLRSKLKKLTHDQVSSIRDAVEKGVAKYFAGGVMSFPAQALIVTGHKPA